MFDPVAKTKILLNMYLLEMKNVTVDQCLAVHERPISIKHKNVDMEIFFTNIKFCNIDNFLWCQIIGRGMVKVICKLQACSFITIKYFKNT